MNTLRNLYEIKQGHKRPNNHNGYRRSHGTNRISPGAGDEPFLFGSLASPHDFIVIDSLVAVFRPHFLDNNRVTRTFRGVHLRPYNTTAAAYTFSSDLRPKITRRAREKKKRKERKK